MVLFERRFLSPIIRGDKTITIRKYKYRSWIIHSTNLFHDGNRLKIRIESTEALGEITREMALSDGFTSVEEMKAYIESYSKWKSLYIVHFTPLFYPYETAL